MLTDLSGTAAAARAADGGVAAADVSWQRARLADALMRHRHEAALALTRCVADWDKYKKIIEDDVEEFTRREMYALVDYLGLYLRSGDVTYKHLYVGEKLKQLYDARQSPDEAARRKEAVTEADAGALVATLRGKVLDTDLRLLRSQLDDVGRVVASKAERTLNVLMVGDCLFLDLVAFATGPCLEDGVALNPTFVTSKSAAEQRKALRGLVDKKFDLVVYSPFTYEFNLGYSQFMYVRHALSPAAHIRRAASDAAAEAEATLDVLSDLFECNIFVHNSANVRRHDGSFKEQAKNLITRRARRIARECVNPRLSEYVAKRNAATFEHLFVLDETPLLAEQGEQALGQMYYDSDLQHPAAMGKWLAGQYRDIVAAHALLLKRKLVVCDLDNTLWKGVIGEGSGVEHYGDKQRILKRLQAKGVVLAINSKNDPKNVCWDSSPGAVLCENDFVCAQINWDNKVLNTKRIAQTLNLKPKDFVFVDDRADERGMVKESIPEVHVLDATDERSWRLMGLWANYLSSAGETDRTQFYKQREQRQAFLETQEQSDADQAELFGKLGITVHVREAAKPDFKRVAELINRTNQFNLCGSRTSVREVTEWVESGGRRVFVVDAADKFGSMGTVCILIARATAECVEVPVFVLSCRVFGYGIEQAMLNHVKRMARKAGAGGTPLPVVGLYQETIHNEPCRKVYPANGFEWNGAAWVYNGAATVEPPDPKWLTIRYDVTEPMALAR
jgi:FkbH-like protein